jgi:uncharacterized protein (UPF0248 family)
MVGMEGWSKFLNKKVVVYYDDGKQVSKKVGVLSSIGEKFLFLKVSDNDIILPIERIVRIELGGKNDQL